MLNVTAGSVSLNVLFMIILLQWEKEKPSASVFTTNRVLNPIFFLCFHSTKMLRFIEIDQPKRFCITE